MSEKIGRRHPLLIGLAFFALFCVPIARADRLSIVLACRFLSGAFGSSSMAVAGGALTDLWSSAVSRGIAMDCFVATGFIGPVLGPIAGTFIVHSWLGWRWTMWITAIVSATVSLFAFLFLPETYKPILNQSRSPKQIPKRPTQPVGNRLARFKKASILFLQEYLSRPVGQYFFYSPAIQVLEALLYKYLSSN